MNYERKNKNKTSVSLHQNTKANSTCKNNCQESNNCRNSGIITIKKKLIIKQNKNIC